MVNFGRKVKIMCFYSKLSQDALKIANRFKAQFIDAEEYNAAEMINGFSFPKTPIVKDKFRDKIQLCSWGLVPSFAKDLEIRKYTLNARIETIDSVRSFKDYTTSRCLVIADGFYEWKREVVNGKEFKIRHLITCENESLFAFAGLYCNDTFTILTTEANELMSEIHNTKKRMPIILSQSDEEKWLNGADYRNFAYPYQVHLKAKAV